MASPNSRIFYVGDDESQSFINLHSTSSHGNSPNFVPRCGPTGGNNNLTIPWSSVADRSNAVQRQDPTSLRQRLQREEMLQQQRQRWLQQQLQLRQMRHQQQQLQLFRGPSLYGDSVCARRLVEYLYHLRHRPSNSIAYWRNIMTEFFFPLAKQRWCRSSDNNWRPITPGLFPQAATVKWECNLCDSKSGIGFGFEAMFDSFPKIQVIKFKVGVLDELYTCSGMSERRYDSGITVLEYANVVKQTVYEHVLVVCEGHLRVTFTPQLKILSWEFCTRRRLKLLRQVNQVAEECQSTINQSGSNGISQQDLQANSNLVMAARSQLAKSVEQLVNGSRGLPPDVNNNSLNKHMALRNSGTNIAMMNTMNGQGSLPASAQATTASVLSNNQTMLMEQNHPKSEPNNTTIKQEPSTRNQNASQGYQGSGPLLPGFVQIKQEPSISGVSSHLSPQQQTPSSIYNGSTQQYHQQPPSGGSSGNQTLEQKPLCVPAAETPSTSDKGTNGF